MGSLALFAIIIVVYSVFQARNIIFGPSIDLTSPIDGETYTAALIDIKGIVHNANTFTIDDNPVLTDKNGGFDNQLLLSPGYNIIKVQAGDKFGKTTKVMLQVILKETPQTIISPVKIVATTTEATSTNKISP